MKLQQEKQQLSPLKSKKNIADTEKYRLFYLFIFFNNPECNFLQLLNAFKI